MKWFISQLLEFIFQVGLQQEFSQVIKTVARFIIALEPS